ncbi:RloB domain-containing protein [Promicromonospora sp. NPDC019610]|uniref:RloB domain-containing protein n=1 Tax=Promicromonospora sp. NPDC019610 TaxID=3364405 RepID=UPI0037A7C279
MGAQRGRGRRPSKPLTRRAGTRRLKKTIWVFTEGKKTEPDYVRALKQLDHVRESTSIVVEIARDHVVPFPLVQKALAKAGADDVDEVWCLFDVESPTSHPRLREARAARLRAGHESAGTTIPDDNPSTTVDQFVEAVERAATTSG